MISTLPVPSVELAMRVGCIEGTRQQRLEHYDGVGAILKQAIAASLPADWSWPDRKSLDFGCGAGRVLRHFGPEAHQGEIWGCDIDGPSIAWVREHLCPPFQAFLVSEQPGLPHADGYFDLVWALSVFTHLTDQWAGWLLELHRVLAPGGYLIATFMGADMSAESGIEEWDEDRVGMLVTGAGRPWSEGGPRVSHSEWWLRAHWGRAFEIVKLELSQGQPGSHSLIVMRARPVRLTVDELELPEAGDPREFAAMRANLAALTDENRDLRDRATRSEAKLRRRWKSRLRASAKRYAGRRSGPR